MLYEDDSDMDGGSGKFQQFEEESNVENSGTLSPG